MNLKHLRNLIGVVSQEPILFDGTIEENIKLGNDEIDDKAVKEACRVANAVNFIEHLPAVCFFNFTHFSSPCSELPNNI